MVLAFAGRCLRKRIDRRISGAEESPRPFRVRQRALLPLPVSGGGDTGDGYDGRSRHNGGTPYREPYRREPVFPGREPRVPREIDEMSEAFVHGIARRWGVPEERVRREVADKWAKHYAAALLTQTKRIAMTQFAEDVIQATSEIMKQRVPMTRRYIESMARFSNRSPEEIEGSRMVRRFRDSIFGD